MLKALAQCLPCGVFKRHTVNARDIRHSQSVHLAGDAANIASATSVEPAAPLAEGNGHLVVRIFDGDEFAIDLATVQTVGAVRLSVCEAYGQKPDAIQIFTVDGEQVADECIVSSLATMELIIIFANPMPTAPPTTSRMNAKMALTGKVLQVELDTTLSVGAVRQQIAAALGTGDDMVVLMDVDGGDLTDSLVLGTLGLSDLRVAIMQRSIPIGPRESSTCTAMARGSKRLCDDMRDFHGNAPCGFTAEEADPNAEHSLYCWRVWFPWPEHMPHQEDRCEIIMRFPFTYPWNPPEVIFVDNVQHWAVASNGKALMDILGTEWSPALTGRSVAVSLHSLLHEGPEL